MGTPFELSFPFDDADDESDLVVRSSDSVLFPVFSNIVSLASPVLRAQIRDLKTASRKGKGIQEDTMNGKTIVQMGENSFTLDALLRLCYPVRDPNFDKLEKLEPVLRAAMKYRMELVADKLRHELTSTFLDKDPIGVFACACLLGLQDERHAAAKCTLPLRESSFDSTLLDQIPAADYVRLLRYRRTGNESILTIGWSSDLPPENVFIPPTNPTPAAITRAAAPFDHFHLADIILRSQDRVDFHVCRAILASASSVFEGMFSIPQPSISASSTSSDELPVVELTEDSSTLDQLLRTIYPIVSPPVEDLNSLRRMYVAATKYDIELAQKHAKDRLSSFATKDPAGVYAVACLLGLEHEARKAAKQSLSKALEELDTPGWDLVHGGVYRRLERYHNSCARLASVVAVTNNGAPTFESELLPRTIACMSCGQPSSLQAQHYASLGVPYRARDSSALKTWWVRFMEDAHRSLLQRPGDLTVVSMQHLLMTYYVVHTAVACQQCIARIHEDLTGLTNFCARMTAEVEAKLASVELEFEA